MGTPRISNSRCGRVPSTRTENLTDITQSGTRRNAPGATFEYVIDR